jgi:hypothetical protein
VTAAGVDGLDTEDVRTEAAAEAGRSGAAAGGETDLDAVREDLVVVDRRAGRGRVPRDDGRAAPDALGVEVQHRSGREDGGRDRHR